ncbi:MAG TPA: ABC transporter ATP-binding protein [Thermoanaerobaculia bacterium]|nr:ABC transporter ATP-binding protein [Thermoanaerobaculia bacterium]
MSPIRRLLHYFARHRWSLALGALCVVGSAAFSLTKPLIVGTAVDALAVSSSRRDLVWYGLLFVGAAAMQGIFLYLQRWIIIGTSRRIEYDMRGDLYEHLQSLPLAFYNEQRTGDLMSRATNDLSSVRMLIGPAVMHSFSSLLIVFGAFVMMLRIETGLALISLIAVPIVAGLVKYFGERIHDRFRMVQDHFGDISARVQENLAGVRVVRAFTQERNEIETFRKMNREYVERNRSLIKLTATFYPALHAMIGVMFVVVFFVGGRRILGGTMSIGEFVAFQFYLARMIWPLIALGWVINLFQRGMASMKRLVEVWDVAPERPGEQLCEPQEFRGALELRRLTFAYPGGPPVLREIDLNVEPGQTVGIVGRTGSGKSTLLALLARLWEPPEQSVFLDGCAIEAIPTARLRDIIAVVPQETFLFSDTIGENIRFGRAGSSEKEIESMAELAGLRDDVTGFPSGFSTVIGERGITLSGGQKQRTAIARALIRNPVILMLDDALSAVDTATEERILDSLRAVRRGRTVLIVSHRASSVKDADQIVVLDQGAIVERGTHEELIGLDGYYADLYRRQALEEEIEEIA